MAKKKVGQKMSALKIRKGDEIIVITGNDKGARGKVLKVLPRQQRVVVEGVNMRKKHQSAQQAGRSQTQGGIVQFEAPIHVSNVMLIDPTTGEPTRVGLRRDEDGKRVRYAKKSEAVLD